MAKSSPLATAFLMAAALAAACGLVESASNQLFGSHNDVANNMVEQGIGAGIAAKTDPRGL
jgi:hypothetical protein